MTRVISPDDYKRASPPAARSLAGVPAVARRSEVSALDTQYFGGLTDPALAEFMSNGNTSSSGVHVNASNALFVSTVFRCVDLISSSIGMLPCHVMEAGSKKAKATGHWLYDLMYIEPNGFQSAFEFRMLMQSNVLRHGNAYAIKVWNWNRSQVNQLIPIDPRKVEPKLGPDFRLVYTYTNKEGTRRDYPAEDMFHLKGLSEDGITGVSRIKVAQEAIGLAMSAEKAAGRLYRNGTMMGGILEKETLLSDTAYNRLQASMEERYSGADNAGKTLILEEGLTWKEPGNNARDAQLIENRKHQIEEIGRVFGVPRPLLMMDDTSWGTGIEQLSIGFVTYALQPWFTMWEQAVSRQLLTKVERQRLYAKFNAHTLLRGSLDAQSSFFSRALGSGGGRPFATQNEVRDLLDWPEHEDGDSLNPPAPEPAAPQVPNPTEP